jgi:hypothetical protein
VRRKEMQPKYNPGMTVVEYVAAVYVWLRSIEENPDAALAGTFGICLTCKDVKITLRDCFEGIDIGERAVDGDNILPYDLRLENREWLEGK